METIYDKFRERYKISEKDLAKLEEFFNLMIKVNSATPKEKEKIASDLLKKSRNKDKTKIVYGPFCGILIEKCDSGYNITFNYADNSVNKIKKLNPELASILCQNHFM